MAKFLALTSRGLLDVLEAEFKELGFKRFAKTAFGVSFEGSWAECYRANLELRTATRVVLPVLDFPAYRPEELYQNILRHDFTKYIDPETQTLAVEASVRDSGEFRDQRFVAMKVKDAVVDQFREKLGLRPSVNTESPDLKIVVRAVKQMFSVSIDTSGQALSFRGYRQDTSLAPLREHLAAGLLKMTSWTPDKPLVDLMCGSGTWLIEAALMAQGTPVGSLRRGFAFERLKNFQADLWDEVLSQSLNKETEAHPLLFGFDLSSEAIKASRANARRAGVDELIRFQRSAVDQVQLPEELKAAPPGVVVVNPPYGQRLGNRYELEDLYQDLAFTLKGQFKGWSCYLLSGDPELTQALKMRATRRFPVHNGPIECRFLEYKINP